MQMPDGLIPSSLGPSSALGPGLNSRCRQCPSFGRGQHDGKPSNLLSEQGGEHQDGAWTTGCWWPSPLANPIRLPPHTTTGSFKTNPFEPMSYAFFLLPWQAFPFISTPSFVVETGTACLCPAGLSLLLNRCRCSGNFWLTPHPTCLLAHLSLSSAASQVPPAPNHAMVK